MNIIKRVIFVVLATVFTASFSLAEEESDPAPVENTPMQMPGPGMMGQGPMNGSMSGPMNGSMSGPMNGSMSGSMMGQRSMKRQARKQNRAARFENVDTDGDGKVTEKELTAFRDSRKAMRAGKGKAMKNEDKVKSFKELDKNNDGFVSKEEFVQRGSGRKGKK